VQTALVATRGTDDSTVEAEPVVVETTGSVVRLVLDDGEFVEFDRRELATAIDGPGALAA
jgi:hypothetical protein